MGARLCVHVYARPRFICLALRVKASDSCLEKGPRDKQGTSWRPPAGLESRAEGKWIALTPISPLIRYRLCMGKRLLSADSAETVCDAFVRLLSSKGSAALPFLAANAKHCYLE